MTDFGRLDRALDTALERVRKETGLVGGYMARVRDGKKE